jgi:hypothetical protein
VTLVLGGFGGLPVPRRMAQAGTIPPSPLTLRPVKAISYQLTVRRLPLASQALPERTRLPQQRRDVLRGDF